MGRLGSKINVSNIVLLFFICYGLAHAAPDRIYETTSPQYNKIVAEELYVYSVREYAPHVRVEFVQKANASYESPEKAVISAISAMAAKDTKWFRNTWTKESQQVLEKNDRSLNRGPDFWPNLWKNNLGGKKAELTHRIETGEYVLIAYKFVPTTDSQKGSDNQDKEIELVTVLKRQGGQWLATQELSSDPVLLYWKTPDFKIKRIARGADVTGVK